MASLAEPELDRGLTSSDFHLSVLYILWYFNLFTECNAVVIVDRYVLYYTDSNRRTTK